MDLLPSDEQQEIIDQTAGFLRGELPVRRLHDLEAPGERVSAATWKAMAELGWFGLGLREEQGGVGFSLAEETLLLREIGRALGPPSLLATVLAARCAAQAELSEVRDALVAGEARAALAQGVGWPAAALGAKVSGTFHLFDAAGADYLLAVGPEGAALLAADVAAAARQAECVDDTVELSVATLDGNPALAFVPADRDWIHARAVVLSAAMLVGLAEAVRDDAVAYATERVQFGKPIGVFQAIKHPCADMAVGCEAALSQTLMAALSVRDSQPDGGFQAACAKAVAGRAASRSAAANVQIHGGYGFTSEYDAHLSVKRAHLLDVFAGTERAQLAAVLAAPPPQ